MQLNESILHVGTKKCGKKAIFPIFCFHFLYSGYIAPWIAHVYVHKTVRQNNPYTYHRQQLCAGMGVILHRCNFLITFRNYNYLARQLSIKLSPGELFAFVGKN